MFRVGIDVGGTFTDIVVYNEESGQITSYKILTNPKDIPGTIIKGLNNLDIEINKIISITHATTIGTNMFFGQPYITLPKACLITTRGFRDIIEIGRQNRSELYNLFFNKPKPLIPRRYRYEITERNDSFGNVVEPIKEEEILKLSKVINNERFKVVIIAFINSHINGVNEEKIRESLMRLCPKANIVISSEVYPVEGEYERITTAIINGILKPVLSDYLTSLINKLRREKFQGPLLIMQSDGGIAPVEYAVKLPVGFIESGPAAGAVAVSYYAKLLGDELAISFDMGGTTAKAALTVNGNPLITDEYEIGGVMHYGRLIRGSGYPLKYPFIDLVEVSAGGGTIAWVDKGGALRIGPMSAGAYPGPACYGFGGEKPTITDANLILGRLGDYLAGGAIKLDRDKAKKAIATLADELGLDIVETAYRIVEIANNNMSRAIRIVTIERGYDPAKSVLYAYGGAGPLHASEIALEIGIKTIKIPLHPGMFSAAGLLLSDYKFETIESVLRSINELSDEYVERKFVDMERKLRNIAKSCGSRNYGRAILVKLLDLRYKGQIERIQVSWRGSLIDCENKFKKQYMLRYGYVLDDPIEVVALKMQMFLKTNGIKLRKQKVIPHKPKPEGFRDVFIEEDWHEVPVYKREKLKAGAYIEGPAIIEEYDSTSLILSEFTVFTDQFGNLVIEVI